MDASRERLVNALRSSGQIGAMDAFGNYTPQKPQVSLWDKMQQTWPARLAQTAWSAAMLPGEVYRGEVNPNSQEAIERSADLAGFATGVPGGIGGLGSGARFAGRAATHLPMDEASRLARARQMGFDPDRTVYHGTPDSRGIWEQGFTTPKQRLSGTDPEAVYFFSDDAKTAGTYADDHRAWDYQNAEPEVIPTHLKMTNPAVIDWGGKPFRGRVKDGEGFSIHDYIDQARAAGHDGVIIRNVRDTYDGKGKPTTIRAVFNANQIRSTDAVFDPEKAASTDILAAGRNPVAGAGYATARAAAEKPQGIRAYHGSPHDGTNPAMKYPMAPRDHWYGDANYQTTGGQIIEMTPDEFLSRARPMAIDDVARDNIDDLKRHIQQGGELDPLALYPTGKEDGRHRALAAKELGITVVPVLVWGSK